VASVVVLAVFATGVHEDTLLVTTAVAEYWQSTLFPDQFEPFDVAVSLFTVQPELATLL
jgi:hypothetical protein